MGQQVTYRNRADGRPRDFRIVTLDDPHLGKGRQNLANRLVQTNDAVLDQHHRADTGDGLRLGEDAENRPLVHHILARVAQHALAMVADATIGRSPCQDAARYNTLLDKFAQLRLGFRQFRHIPAGLGHGSNPFYIRQGGGQPPFQDGRSARSHADGAVQTDDFSVQHRIFNDILNQLRKFIRTPQPRRVRHLLAERILRRLGQALQHRRQENARRDRHHPDAVLRQITRDRQRHPNHAAFGSGIGGLADLTIKGSDRRGIDDHARFFAIHPRSGKPGGETRNDVEAADQVDLDGLAKCVERVRRSILPHHAEPRRHACAIYQYARRSQLRLSRRQCRVHRLRAGHVHMVKAAAQPLGQGSPRFLVQVEDSDAGAKLGQPCGGRAAQPRSTAGHDGAQIPDVHDRSSVA